MVPILKKSDIVLIVLLILFAAGFYFIFNHSRDSGNTVSISVNGSIYTVLSLSEDTEIHIFLADNTHINTLTVKDGEAYMTYADCPDGLCLNQHPVKLTGEMIVCLPNRIVVTVSGEMPVYDAVAG